MVALVALAAVLLSGASALATRQLLLHNVDTQLQYSTSRIRNDSGPGGDPGGGLFQPGQVIGTFVAVYTTSGQALFNVVQGDGRQQYRMPAVAVSELYATQPTSDITSVTLTGLGHYRVVSYTRTLVDQNGDTIQAVIVTGVPLAQVDHTLVSLLIMQGLLSVLAIGGAAIGARTLVIRSLRPLNRVAGIAQQVSRLPLDRGEVALAVRVAPADADPSSEVGRVGQAINHMLANVDGALAARQASEMKVRQFVADASHELRNPLASIRGYAELTRRGRDELPPDAAYAMTRVESEAARMSKLVEDLLLLARLDSGPDMQVRPIDLAPLVIDAVSDARAAGPDHQWALELPDEPVVALGEPNRVLQVLTNLLANARNHTPEGTRVEVGLGHAADGRALITVTDDGPGIPDSLQASVFERFTRADSSRARSLNGTPVTSTGLGLAIVAAVVEAHHGEVRVESRPGRTRFSVFLPAVTAS
ncbi:two-component system OmpR family sensor kinase [Friedmanniella endophytica]|uniref:histidine kinase n=1 Tax=Microlunatus kandeliicorticis TaxID=1759536 RepID=A0A7W3IQJ6_9ACTN|nr:HAMP domain-containing sensor histidine kinase [Microlunatus kandeliicorticis]MBA8793402.1 two-component system OmpR family sensor kinase [Microlunatus kandeliicorticis]